MASLATGGVLVGASQLSDPDGPRVGLFFVCSQDGVVQAEAGIGGGAAALGGQAAPADVEAGPVQVLSLLPAFPLLHLLFFSILCMCSQSSLPLTFAVLI